MILPYYSSSRYESEYECICIMINAKTRSVPLNILRAVYNLTLEEKKRFCLPKQHKRVWLVVIII